MKFQRGLILLVICGLLLAACGPNSDGTTKMAIGYQTEEGVEYIIVTDTYHGNGIYVDQSNARVYCKTGPDNVVQLPPSAQVGYPDFPNIDIKVEAVCLMGQEKFDQFLGLFELVPTTP